MRKKIKVYQEKLKIIDLKFQIYQVIQITSNKKITCKI